MRVFKVIGLLISGATSPIVLASGRNKLLLPLSSHNLKYHLDETGRCLLADHVQFLSEMRRVKMKGRMSMKCAKQVCVELPCCFIATHHDLAQYGMQHGWLLLDS